MALHCALFTHTHPSPPPSSPSPLLSFSLLLAAVALSAGAGASASEEGGSGAGQTAACSRPPTAARADLMNVSWDGCRSTAPTGPGEQQASGRPQSFTEGLPAKLTSALWPIWVPVVTLLASLGRSAAL